MSELVLFDTSSVPAHLSQDGGLGNDNVDASDIAMPRINLLQQLSPQVSKSKPEFIKGAEPGQFFNTVTQEVSDELFVVNLYYEKTWAVFRARSAGGGDFQGNHVSEQAAKDHLKAAGKDVSQYDITETANHYLLLVNPATGQAISPAIMSMQSTKLATSRAWNTALALQADTDGTARFASVWKLQPKSQTNKNGQDFFNLDAIHVGWAPEGLYDVAKVEYEKHARASSSVAA